MKFFRLVALIACVVAVGFAATIIRTAGAPEQPERFDSIRSSKGFVVAEGGYRSQKKHGEWRYWYGPGLPLAMGGFYDDEPDGLWIVWNFGGDAYDEKRRPATCDGFSFAFNVPGVELIHEVDMLPEERAKLVRDGVFPFRWSSDWRGAGLYERGRFVRGLNESEVRSALSAYQAMSVGR